MKVTFGFCYCNVQEEKKQTIKQIENESENGKQREMQEDRQRKRESEFIKNDLELMFN